MAGERWLCYVCKAALSADLAEETVVVTAQPVDSASAPTVGYQARTSAGASKTDLPLVTTGQPVSVITRQQMADQGGEYD